MHTKIDADSAEKSRQRLCARVQPEWEDACDRMQRSTRDATSKDECTAHSLLFAMRLAHQMRHAIQDKTVMFYAMESDKRELQELTRVEALACN